MLADWGRTSGMILFSLSLPADWGRMLVAHCSDAFIPHGLSLDPLTDCHLSAHFIATAICSTQLELDPVTHLPLICCAFITVTHLASLSLICLTLASAVLMTCTSLSCACIGSQRPPLRRYDYHWHSASTDTSGTPAGLCQYQHSGNVQAGGLHTTTHNTTGLRQYRHSGKALACRCPRDGGRRRGQPLELGGRDAPARALRAPARGGALATQRRAPEEHWGSSLGAGRWHGGHSPSLAPWSPACLGAASARGQYPHLGTASAQGQYPHLGTAYGAEV